MKKNTSYSILIKLIGALLSVILVLCSSGCSTTQIAPSVPEQIMNLKERIELKSATSGSVQANLYYDNTLSMYGYVCAGSGSSEFSIVFDRIIDMVESYPENTANVLKPDENKEFLKWESISTDEVKDDFRLENFYTQIGEFNKAKGEYGPLQTLFKDESLVDFDQLNIFITDLAEQKLNNYQLAEKINSIVLPKEDQSVALYRISSHFFGYAAVPIPKDTNKDGTMRMLENFNFNSKRSFYCMIVGPTVEVVGICEDMDKELSKLGLKERSDYNYLTALSHRGVGYSSIENADASPFNNLYISNERHSIYDGNFDITKNNSNINYNMELLDHSDLIFNSDEGLPGLFYKYNLDYGENYEAVYNYAKINFMLPLSNLSNGKIANPDEIEYEIDMNSFKVLGAVLNDNSEYEWSKIPQNKLLDSSSPYMENPSCKIYEKGSKVYITDDNDVQELIFDKYAKEDIEVYTVENESGALLVEIPFKNMLDLQENYDYILIDFDIKALRNLSGSAMPEWINQYSMPLSSIPDDYKKPNKNPEFFTKTIGLDIFYSYLIGDNIPSSYEMEYRNAVKTVVSDVVIAVDLRH